MNWFYHAIRHALSSWGYLAVVGGLFSEDMGLPLPGETVLMFASFASRKGTGLHIYWVILAGIGACVLGDNMGYLLGRHFGRTFIRWAKKLLRLDDEEIDVARHLIATHGGATIFFSRFIFGLRTIAGPTAGSLAMPWPRFFKFNLLGAATWVSFVSLLGYAFSNEFNTLLGYIEKGSWAVAGGMFTIGYLIWRHEKKRYKAEHPGHSEGGHKAA